jgi:Asp-tRNA(Asn)/Glu-tRNA(Gln) amidotransferase A subunit family amidase
MTPIIETKLAPLAEQLRSGQLKVADYLKALETHFVPENERIQAFLPEEGRFERLQREAAALEEAYQSPQARPPLFGVPVGVKDIYHVDGFLTRAGSQLPPDVLAGPEAKSVTQLKKAGALILGKTVTTEFAYFDPGPTRNPHNIEHTPGGSSSGSAAAVAAGLAPVALGSQTIGSIIRPAAYCGIVGYKPTAKRISADGVISVSPSLDHMGFFTQDLDGLALTASVLCKDWFNVQPSAQKPGLGVPIGPYLDKTSPEGRTYFENVVNKLEQAGFTVKAIDTMPDIDEILVWHMDLMAGEMAQVHKEWFQEYRDLYHPKTAAMIERGHQVDQASIRVYLAEREWLRSELRDLMVKHDISVWISPPALGTAPKGLNFTGDPVMNLPWTYAGIPVITIPTGTGENNLPLGLQLAADCNKDELLVHWSKQVFDALTT